MVVQVTAITCLAIVDLSVATGVTRTTIQGAATTIVGRAAVEASTAARPTMVVAAPWIVVLVTPVATDKSTMARHVMAVT